MKFPSMFLLFINCVLFFSCSRDNKLNIIDQRFNNYLVDNFPSTTFPDTSIYILIPAQICGACQNSANQLLSYLKKSKNVFIILSSKNEDTNPMPVAFDKNHMLVDSTETIDKLDIGVNSASFILKIHSRISYIAEMNWINVDQINTYINLNVRE